MGSKYVLVDEEFQNEMRKELKELKLLLTTSALKPVQTEDLMDTADAMAFLKVTRRTLLKYRIKNGLPFEQMENGKIYYSRQKIMQFLSDQNSKNQ